MIKNLLLTAGLLSLALATGCAVGGSGPCMSNCASISVVGSSNGVSPVDLAAVSAPGAPQQITFTANPQNTTLSAANWSLSGNACSGSSTSPSNPCGFFTTSPTGPLTVIYQSPNAVPALPNNALTITATSQSNSSLSGSVDVTIIPITTAVTPATTDVGVNVTQEFMAVAIPDNAPQTFSNWSCTCSSKSSSCSGNCSKFAACPGGTGDWCYTATSAEVCNDCSVTISTESSVDPTGCQFSPTNYTCLPATATAVQNRINGTYGFRFSGFDNSGHQVLVAGTFTAAGSGNGNATISGGVEDRIAWNGSQYAATTGISISGGSFSPTCTAICSNNAGTLVLTSGGYPSTFQAVLDSAGNIQMISDNGGNSGSGVAELVTASNKFNIAAQTYVFGLTGVDSSGSRVGAAGLLPLAGSGSFTGGLMDVNDAGSGSTSILCSSACTVSYNGGSNQGSLTVTAGGVTQTFDFFVANGGLNSGSPLNAYVISTSTVDGSHPALLGKMTLQNSNLTYNNKAFNGVSVSALTGVDGNSSVVSLTLGTTDGTSGGSGGTGNFIGQFDQNDAGTILTVPAFPSASQQTNPYTYVSTNGNTGRYLFYMLGNPGASLNPIPIVLYAYGANRGFLLDQSSAAVMTGTMTEQQSPTQNSGSFVPASMPGTYAVATNSNSLANAADCSQLPSCAVVMNLLLTSPGSANFVVGGTVTGGSTVNVTAGKYSIIGNTGTGTVSTTTSSGAANFVIYATSGTTFYMIEEDKTVPSPVLYMAQ
jgi:hypothetical protein